MRRDRDYRRPRRRPKEGWAAALLALALALAGGCHSSGGCINAIPAKDRANAVRLAIDEKFVPMHGIPRADYEKAMLEGLPPGEHDPEYRKRLRGYAVRYQICTQDASR